MRTNDNNSKIKYDVPEWLLEKETELALMPAPSKMRFMRETMKNIAQVFENEFFSEKYASLPRILQLTDARVKLCVFLFFIVLSSFTSSLAALTALAAIPLVYAKVSGLPLKSFFKRVWLYIPLLVLILSIPGASSLFVGGKPLFYAIQPGVFGIKSGVYFSAAGISTALRLTLRAGISLSFGFLLLLTTRWSHITGGLAHMHIPQVFISILNIAYRYIFVMSEIAVNMMDARKLRTVGKVKTAENRNFMGRSTAFLFIKSHYMSEEIYDAMSCRGFTGNPVSLTQMKIGAADILFIISSGLIALLLIAGDYLL